MLTTVTPGAQASEGGEQRGEAVERRAVAGARGDGNDGRGGEAGDDAREGGVHAGDDDQHARGLERVELVEQAVQAGDADVGDAVDGVTHELGGDGGLLQDRQVGCATAEREGAGQRGRRVAAAVEAERGGGRVGAQVGDGAAERGGLRVGPRDEQAVRAREHLLRGGDDLRRGLAVGEDDLRERVTEGAMVVDAGEADVAVGKVGSSAAASAGDSAPEATRSRSSRSRA